MLTHLFAHFRSQEELSPFEKGFGGKSFLWLRSQNKLELTSEWFIARHAPELVSAETLAALNALLSSDEKAFAKAA